MKLSLSILGLIALCCLSEALFLRLRRRGRHGKALVFKGLASLFFCLLGLMAAVNTGTSYGWLIFSGLCIGFVGDLLLGLRKLFPLHRDLCFLAGAAAFCLGHVLYLLALGTQHKSLLLPSLPIFLLLVLGSELFARESGFSRGKMHLPGLFYIGVEALLCACSLTLLSRRPGSFSLVLALGGICFLVSDNLLCAFSFGHLRSTFVDRLLHITYLAAQLCIGLSIFFL